MLRTSHSVRVGIAAVIALVISAGCGGGAGSDEAASDDGNDRDVIVADIYDFWAESSAATAESLDLALADVVDRACIADAVAQFSDADAALLVAQANGEITDDISDAAYDVMDSIREDCVDFTGG